MEESVRLGRVHGIDIGLNWSVLAIAALLAVNLALAVLPDAAPGYGDAWYWVLAIVAAVAFFAGLLAHELAHSIVAQRRGVGVEGITLWLFGGVSRLRSEAATWRDALRIALAGPLTSFAVAAVFGVLALGLEILPGLDLLAATAEWLAFINVLLAVFNLAPAAPLDGGRVLHALVWRRTGDRNRATIVATRAGRVFGYVMIGSGVLLVAAGGLAGIWFVLLGWFLLSAARAEETHVLLRGALSGVRVRDVMTPDPVVAPADVTVAALLDDYVLRRHCSAFPLVADERVVGLVTLRQVRRVPAEHRERELARDIATPIERVPTGAPDEPVIELVERMAASPESDGRALVFDRGALVGIVSPTDVNRALDLASLRQRPGLPPPARPAPPAPPAAPAP